MTRVTKNVSATIGYEPTVKRIRCTFIGTTITILIASICTFVSLGAVAQRNDGGAEEEQIHQIEKRLPLDSELLKALNKGERGRGIRYPWMDSMHSQGVKHAWILIYLGIRKRPQDAQVMQRTYYIDYNGGTSEITDPTQLLRIQNSGLAAALDKVALERLPENSWYQKGRALAPIELFDNEWLPASTYSDEKAHLADVSSRLKHGSDLWLELRAGAMGDGADHEWTSKMRNVGVKSAIVVLRINFDPKGVPAQVKAGGVKYYADYENRTSIDPNSPLFRKIDDIGLEKDLSTLALDSARHGFWAELPRPVPSPFVGGAIVTFYDDPWLPSDESPGFFVGNGGLPELSH